MPSEDENQPMIFGQPQPVVINPNTGMPQNVIIMQSPSSAPGVVGIFVIIYGAISLLGSALGILGSTMLAAEIDDEIIEKYATQLMIYSFASLIISAGLIVSGVWMNQRKTKGIHLGLLMIGIGFILSMIQQFTLPTELNQGFGTAIDSAIALVCNGICALIVAIPMMVSNSGMDDSKLFG